MSDFNWTLKSHDICMHSDIQTLQTLFVSEFYDKGHKDQRTN